MFDRITSADAGGAIRIENVVDVEESQIFENAFVECGIASGNQMGGAVHLRAFSVGSVISCRDNCVVKCKSAGNRGGSYIGADSPPL
jgi:hypothetical protein